MWISSRTVHIQLRVRDVPSSSLSVQNPSISLHIYMSGNLSCIKRSASHFSPSCFTDDTTESRLRNCETADEAETDTNLNLTPALLYSYFFFFLKKGLILCGAGG